MSAMKAIDHPAPRQLERFLRGEATRTEKHAVVRHLLAGCSECTAVLRPVWGLAERPLLSMKALEG